MEIPFHMESLIGPDLRDYPVDPEQMRGGIRFLEGLLEEKGEGEERLRITSQLAGYYRIVGELELSQRFHLMVDGKTTDRRLRTANAIRLATTEQFLGNYAEALHILDETEKLVRENPDLQDYLDFIFQHRGKVFFDLGQYADAGAEFRKAAEIRERKNDPHLLESTNFALRVVADRKHSGS